MTHSGGIQVHRTTGCCANRALLIRYLSVCCEAASPTLPWLVQVP